jgi:hypothetical protein
MPLQATSGAASYDGFGGGVAAVPNYIEDVFSTYLYAGSNSTQTITNGIDLSTYGGLVWTKARTTTYNHCLTDTIRGGNKQLFSNTTDASTTSSPAEISSFNTTGYTLAGGTVENVSGQNFVAWTFRKQPKFFDVVTYTGNGVDGRQITHNLGSAPGCIIVKRTDSTSNWNVYHRQAGGSGAAAFWGRLNTTDADTDLENVGPSGTPTTTFLVYDASLGLDSCNINGATYVAYLFAHNAGGFGLTGTDNVISCGSFTTDGSGKASVTLGYEPQWLLMKNADGTDYNWVLMDTMRGWTANTSSSEASLYPNTSGSENIQSFGSPTATGFNASGWYAGQTIIYIAIRRGPMKVPTDATKVFNTVVRAGTGTATSITGVGFPPDFMISHSTNVDTNNVGANDKLRGVPQFLATNTTGAEGTISGALVSLDQNGFSVGTTQAGPFNSSGQTNASWIFRRAPSFFDEVCYTGTGANRTVAHNLTVAPELMIVKQRDIGGYWMVYPVPLGDKYLVLQRTDAVANAFAGLWNSTAPTSSVFSLGTGSDCNQSGGTYVAYLFATCAGVSKCTAFTGTGTLQTINCGFTSGARFVLIKRTDSTGDWYVWDSSRGLSSSTDPYLLLNSTAAEVTSTNWVDTTSTGFQVTAASGNNVNINGASYIALAIA